MRSPRAHFLFLLAPWVLAGAAAAEPDPLQPRHGATVLFLGDSITYKGSYIAMLEAAWLAQHPEEHPIFLNLGLSSETVSGLSEDGHAGGRFPRPDLAERLQRVLDQVKPDLVVACYGMNDGIYRPLDDERFKAYRDGILRLRGAVNAAGAEIIHLTPAAFDATAIPERVAPAGTPGSRMFEGYDQVLSTYSAWLLSMRKEGWTVLDVHGAMNEALSDRRESEPDFMFSKDGVHPGTEGHRIMADPLMIFWSLSADEAGLPEHPEGSTLLQLIEAKQQVLRDAWLTRTGHLRPGVKEGLPLPEAQKEAAALHLKAIEMVQSAE